MANCHYNADSAFPPPLSLRPGMPGSRKEDPAQSVHLPASAANGPLPLPATYALAGGANVHVGKSGHPGCRVPEHGAPDATPGMSGPSTITSIG
jgi:hypothetical protein